MNTEQPTSAESPASPTNEQFWDERYRSAAMIWSGHPNLHLVTDAAGLPPTTALDIGAGEGADAIWLAQRGWQVTAVDISSVGLGRARAQAEQQGTDVAGRITWVHADLTTWAPPIGAFGLVTAQFMHLPATQRDPLFSRCIAAVATGGTLLLVGHDESDLETTVRRPPSRDLYFHAGDVAATLGDGWTVTEAGTRARTAADASGAEVTIHDAVLVARRS